LHLQSRYHSHAVIWTDLTVDATHAGISHDQIVSLTFETLIRHCKETNNHSASSLFLLGVGVISLGLGALLTDTDKAGLGAGVTELPVCVLLTLVVADRTFLEGDDVLDGQSGGGTGNDVLSGLGRLDILSRGVTLLGLSVAAGEENETLPELLEALDVGLEALLGKVLAAGVDRDTDGAGELAGDTGGLQLNERETTAGANAAVVLNGRASHNGAEEVDGTRSDLGSLRNTGVTSGLLLARLVEVHADVALPVLVEMVLLDLLVVLDRHCCGCLCPGYHFHCCGRQKWRKSGE